MKLAPATRFETDGYEGLGDRHAMEQIIGRIGRQYIGWGGSVRQQRWWWNSPAYPPETITISAMHPIGRWHHRTFPSSVLGKLSPDVSILESPKAIFGFVGDTDRTVRAAGVQAVLAHENAASMIGNTHGYLITNASSPPPSPWIEWFAIETVMPLDRKRLRAHLRERRIGILELKSRNIEIDLEALRKELKLEGDQTATLLITRCGLRTLALLVHRTNQKGLLSPLDR